MKVSSFILLGVFCFGLMFRCADHTVIPYDEESNSGRVIGSVHGMVTDFCSQALFEPSDSVKVTWAVEGVTHTDYLDETGFYSITDLNSGQYTIAFTAGDDYAASRIIVTVPDLDSAKTCCEPSNENYEIEIQQNVTLFQRNAGLRGRVMKYENSHNTPPAAGVKVVADYSYFVKYLTYWLQMSWDAYVWDNWLDVFDTQASKTWWMYQFANVYPSKFTTETDANGYFTLDSLPGAPFVYLYTLPWEDSNGVEYIENICCSDDDNSINDDSYKNHYPLYQQVVSDVGDIFLKKHTEAPIIIHDNFISLQDFDFNDSLVVTFSKKINVATFNITLETSASHPDNEVICNLAWEDSLTLTITPQIPLKPGTSYTIHLQGESAESMQFDETYTFTTHPGILFESTNLERVEGILDEFSINSSITFTFTEPLDLSHPDTEVHLYEKYVGPDDQVEYIEVYIEYANTSNSRVLTITHPSPLEMEQEYKLELLLYSTIPGDLPICASSEYYALGYKGIPIHNNLRFNANDPIYFWTTYWRNPPQAVTGLTPVDGFDDETQSYIEFSGADWNTRSIQFIWNPVTDATDYELYAQDNRQNTDWVFVGSTSDIDYKVWQSKTTLLPEEFDYYEDDNHTTPFLESTRITYSIIAVNNAGRSPRAVINALQDVIAPTVDITPRVGNLSANNPTENARELIFDVITNPIEYVNRINLSIIDTDGSTPYKIPDDSIRYVWNSPDYNKTGATVFVTVPADTNAAGDSLRVQLWDTSNNDAIKSYVIN